MSDNIDKQKEEILFQLLTAWFDTFNSNKLNIFNKDKVAKLLKQELKKRGMWKCRKRGKLTLNYFKQLEEAKEVIIPVAPIVSIDRCKACNSKFVNNKCSNLFCEKYE